MSVYEILDSSFKALIDPVAFLEVIHTGNRWAEGRSISPICAAWSGAISPTGG